ncbi:MAG: hypothetical protein M3R54_08340 [Chloroflexota bacterium]|nr:hypothetical protein [Chloroflexota bacterium]
MTLVLLIVAPSAAALLFLLAGARLGRGPAGALGTAALAFAFGIAMAVGQAFAAGKTSLLAEIGQWLPLRGAELALRVDPAAVPLLLTITGIGTLLALAAATEDRGSAGIGRLLFALEALVGGALLVVTARDLVLVLVGWGTVGLSTSLLLGHARHTAEGAIAGVRALVFARASDVALLLGSLALLALFRTMDIAEISTRITTAALAPAADGSLLAASLLIVGAVLVRTAQLPAHLWIVGEPRGPAAASAAVASIATLSGAALLIRLAPALHPAAFAAAAAIGAITAVAAMACALANGSGRRGQAWTTVAQLGTVVVVAAADVMYAAILIAVATALARGATLSTDEAVEAPSSGVLARVLAGIAAIAIFFTAGLLLGHDRAGLALPVLAAAVLASAQLGRIIRRGGRGDGGSRTGSGVLGRAHLLSYVAPTIAVVLAGSSLSFVALALSGSMSLGVPGVVVSLGPVGTIAIVVALIALGAGLRGVALPSGAVRWLRSARATELVYDRGVVALFRMLAATIDRGAEASIELAGAAVGIVLERTSVGLRTIGSGSVWRHEAIFVAATVAIALYWTLR